MTMYKQVRNVWTPEDGVEFTSRRVGVLNVIGLALQLAALVGLVWLGCVVIGMVG